MQHLTRPRRGAWRSASACAASARTPGQNTGAARVERRRQMLQRLCAQTIERVRRPASFRGTTRATERPRAARSAQKLVTSAMPVSTSRSSRSHSRLASIAVISRLVGLHPGTMAPVRALAPLALPAVPPAPAGRPIRRDGAASVAGLLGPRDARHAGRAS